MGSILPDYLLHVVPVCALLPCQINTENASQTNCEMEIFICFPLFSVYMKLFLLH